MPDAAPSSPHGLPPRRMAMVLLSMLALLGLGFLEARTPEELSFGVFYYVPVVAATWYGGPRWGSVTALLAALDYLGANYTSAAVWSRPGLRLWTTGNELLGELCLVFLVRRLRRALQAREEQRSLALEALDDVKTLEEMLPVCAWCKRVRDDQGYWSQLEAYLSRRRQAKFSHGICPACMEKVRDQHPEIYGPPQPGGPA